MGGSVKLPKIKVPKIKLPKISAPKITMDPSKLVTKAVEGVTNMNTQIVGSQIGAVTSLAGQAVGGVGQVMSQPGAGALLGAAGTAMGIPGAGLLASAFAPKSDQGQSQIASQLYPPVPMIGSSGGSDNSNNMMMMMVMGGVGLGGLVLVALLMNKKR